MSPEVRIIRVLKALGFPKMDVLEKTPSLCLELPHAARIVTWVEDRKVREYTIEDRAPLRTPKDGWEEAFFTYVKDVGCPVDYREDSKDAKEALARGLSWLLNKAVACEYEDRGDEYNRAAKELSTRSASPKSTHGFQLVDEQAEQTLRAERHSDREAAAVAVSAASGTPNSSGQSSTSVDAFRGENRGLWSPQFMSALESACHSTGISFSVNLPRSPAEGGQAECKDRTRVAEEVVRTLQRLLEAVRKRTGSIEAAESWERRLGDVSGDGMHEEEEGVHGDAEAELQGFASGVVTSDQLCDRVATVLKMLYLKDLRDAQDEVNALLAAAQSHRTATNA